MSLTAVFVPEKSRLRALLEHFAEIEDPRQQSWRVAYPLPEVLLLVVCGTIADCDDDDGIAAWGEARLPFLRRFLPYHHGVPCARWLTLLMNRIDPNLFSAAFTAWVRQTWPDRLDLVAIDGKTSRRSHDRSADRGPLHLVSAFATTQRLVLGQEAVADKTNEITAIPLLIERLAADDRLKGALVSIDAIATNPIIATAIKDAKADYLLAVKANQPTLRTEIETFFADAPPASLESVSEVDKGHGPDRATHRHRLPRARLARRRAPLSGRAPSTGRSHHHPCRIASRACRSRSLRDPILHLLSIAHCRARRRSRAQPLGHREPPPLGARRHLRRGPVTFTKGPRRKEHGRCQTLRHQSPAHRPGQGKSQTPAKTRRLAARISRHHPRHHHELTRIRSPARHRVGQLICRHSKDARALGGLVILS
jgi:predicted transposase YbfD/YdcC